MSKKRITVLLASSMAILMCFIFYYATTHYSYYTAGEIEKYNNVYVDTKYIEYNDISGTTNNTGIYGPFFAQYSIDELNREYSTQVYNTFKISGLEPVTTYEVSMRFNYEAMYSNGVNTLKVGAIDYQPEQYYDPETKQNYTNISGIEKDIVSEQTTEEVESVANITEVTNEEDVIEEVNNFTSFEVEDGMQTYNLEMTFQTNENGEIWFVIAFDSNGYSQIDYRLSNILIKYTEVK